MRITMRFLAITGMTAALSSVGCGDDDAGTGDGGGGSSMDGGGVGRDGGGVSGDGGGGTGGDGGGMTADTGGPIVVRDGGVVIIEDGGGTFTCFVTACEGHVLQCGDCDDNDGDGLTDSRDPECLGPCDNTEGPAFTADVGGETGGPCGADCYFDFGNGSGGEDCIWDHRCDPRSIAPTFDPEGMDCAFEMSRVGGRTCPATQPVNCEPHCAPLTPNGCDCFGCCIFDALRGRSAAEGGETVWLGSVFEGTNTGSCTFADILDTTLCRPCTQVVGCLNTCETCEICLGRPTLPPECTMMTPDAGPPPDGGFAPYDGGVPPMRCPAGVTPCGLPGDAMCGPDFYCVTGCCQSVII